MRAALEPLGQRIGGTVDLQDCMSSAPGSMVWKPPLMMKLTAKLLCAFICSAAIWELILEGVIIKSPGYRNHPVLGSVLQPGLYLNGEEGFSVTHVNSLGIRNREVGAKRAGSYRILALGDSHTEAIQVGDSRTYCTLTERALWKRFGSRVEVINAGRSAGSPAFYIHLADFYNRTFQPDYVVVQINERDFTEDLLSKNRFFALVPDGQAFKTVLNTSLATDNPITHRFPRLGFVAKLSTFRVAGERLAAARKRPAQESSEGSGRATQLTPQAARALDWSIAGLCRCYPRLLLVYLPTIDYDHPSAGPSEVETRLATAVERYHASYINMRDDFESAYRQTRQPCHGFDNTQPGAGHINARGHALVAAQIIERLSSVIAK